MAEVARLYTPTAVSAEDWAKVGQFTINLLTSVEPETVASARSLLTASARFVDALHRSGLPLDPLAMCQHEVVETQVSRWKHEIETGRKTDCDLESLQTHASRFRTVARAVNPDGGWPVRGETFARNHLKAPYTDEEVSTILRAVAQQTNPDRRSRLSTLIHLTLGAGARPKDLYALTPDSVVLDESGTVRVFMRHESDEEEVPVPVARPHADPLFTIAGSCVSETLLDLGDKNALGNLARPSLGHGVPPLSARRLRTTWLVHRLRAGVAPNELKTWGRYATYGFLEDLAHHLPDQDPRESLSGLTADPTATNQE